MRQVGQIAQKQDAQRFADFLLSQGITSKVEPAAEQWSIWVHDENQLARGKTELQAFLADPLNERYQAARREAEQVRKETALRAKQAQKNFVDLRNEWANPWRRRRVTMSLIVASVLIGLGVINVPEQNNYFSLPEILQGEVWRLVTPIFWHGGMLHLVFNMYWLYELGSMIEFNLGWWRYALFVLVVAILSNTAQYTFVLLQHLKVIQSWDDVNQLLQAAPGFVGMSGVVYGLFGYIWARVTRDPACGLYIRQDTVLILMAWLFLCMTPAIGNVANAAHVGGLVAGGAIGYAVDAFRRMWPKT